MGIKIKRFSVPENSKPSAKQQATKLLGKAGKSAFLTWRADKKMEEVLELGPEAFKGTLTYNLVARKPTTLVVG